MLRRALVIVLLASAALPMSAIAQSPHPSPAPSSPARAKEWLHRIQTGDVDRGQLDAEMNAALTDALEKRVAAQFGPLGDPSEFTLVDVESVAGSAVYIYRATFKSGPLYWMFAIEPGGKISGLRFLPAQ